jgi:hypothetical protein
MTLYRCVNYEDLKDGQTILAFGRHVWSWSFDTMGEPAYGFVPVEEIDMEDIEDLLWEVVDAAKDVATCSEWGTGIKLAEKRLEEAKAEFLNRIKNGKEE